MKFHLIQDQRDQFVRNYFIRRRGRATGNALFPQCNTTGNESNVVFSLSLQESLLKFHLIQEHNHEISLLENTSSADESGTQEMNSSHNASLQEVEAGPQEVPQIGSSIPPSSHNASQQSSSNQRKAKKRKRWRSPSESENFKNSKSKKREKETDRKSDSDKTESKSEGAGHVKKTQKKKKHRKSHSNPESPLPSDLNIESNLSSNSMAKENVILDVNSNLIEKVTFTESESKEKRKKKKSRTKSDLETESLSAIPSTSVENEPSDWNSNMTNDRTVNIAAGTSSDQTEKAAATKSDDPGTDIENDASVHELEGIQNNSKNKIKTKKKKKKSKSKKSEKLPSEETPTDDPDISIGSVLGRVFEKIERRADRNLDSSIEEENQSIVSEKHVEKDQSRQAGEDVTSQEVTSQGEIRSQRGAEGNSTGISQDVEISETLKVRRRSRKRGTMINRTNFQKNDLDILVKGELSHSDTESEVEGQGQNSDNLVQGHNIKGQGHVDTDSESGGEGENGMNRGNGQIVQSESEPEGQGQGIDIEVEGHRKSQGQCRIRLVKRETNTSGKINVLLNNDINNTGTKRRKLSHDASNDSNESSNAAHTDATDSNESGRDVKNTPEIKEELHWKDLNLIPGELGARSNKVQCPRCERVVKCRNFKKHYRRSRCQHQFLLIVGSEASDDDWIIVETGWKTFLFKLSSYTFFNSRNCLNRIHLHT